MFVFCVIAFLCICVFTAEAKSMTATLLKGRKVKALYDFLGENEDELSFKVRLHTFFYLSNST